MTNIHYDSFTQEKTWTKWIRPDEKLTCGMWFRRTIDRPTARNTSANNHELYEYEPLSSREIRVLSLYPGEHGDPITGSLSTTSLDQPCTYDALSYYWGENKFDYGIQINNSTLNITANLFDALHHIRSKTETKLLWTDAICINQHNLEEKAEQVPQMNDIYAKASRVLVWLGPTTYYSEYSEYGMRILASLINANPLGEAPWHTLPSSLVLQGLARIMRRPWFQRLWVVQEVALAKEVVVTCGNHEITWISRIRPVLSILRNIKIIAMSPEWQAIGLHHVDIDPLLSLLQAQLENGPDAQLWAKRSRTPDFLDLAYSMRHRQATDFRDRIYSLLGMIDSNYEIIPDYSKEVRKVWTEFAQKASRQTEIMCSDLEKTMTLNPAALQSEPTQKGVTPVQFLRDGNDTQALSDFVDQTHTRVQENILENDFDGAARLMEGAAMLLRGHQFHAQPKTQDTL